MCVGLLLFVCLGGAMSTICEWSACVWCCDLCACCEPDVLIVVLSVYVRIVGTGSSANNVCESSVCGLCWNGLRCNWCWC